MNRYPSENHNDVSVFVRLSCFFLSFVIDMIDLKRFVHGRVSNSSKQQTGMFV